MVRKHSLGIYFTIDAILTHMHTCVGMLHIYTYVTEFATSIDVLPSKNQALCDYCTLVSKLKHC